jgi:murein tripeptide amidase MpaA
MVNPDGVEVGNYRTNLSGFDLNRRWDCSPKTKTPHESLYIKSYINKISKGR